MTTETTNQAMVSVELTDCELIARFLDHGDRDAIDELFERYYERVFFLILKNCRNTHDAEEIRHKTFISAFESLNKFEGRSSFYTWICRIAINETISFHRSSYNKQRNNLISVDKLNENDKLPEQLQDIADPFVNFKNLELRERLNQANDMLSPEDKIVLQLRLIDELGLAEIAQKLELKLSAAKMRLHRALTKLRELLGGSEFMEDF
jgi:RNA polymerase sigma-70 factor (ECF subfamily)